MKILRILCFFLLMALLVWGIEALYLAQRNRSAPSRIRSHQQSKRRNVGIEFATKERELQHEYETKKYLATGETVYDRIFNTQNQSVTALIHRIAIEAFPDNCSCDVKVEEFTHFLLLLYLPHNSGQAAPENVTSYLPPILQYCYPYLSSVAVLDRTHKSYLFFDTEMLEHTMRRGSLTDDLAERARQQGEAFTRFNSVTIECETHNSHLMLPIEIIGPDGVVTCYALLDTGASTTMVADAAVLETGGADLLSAPRRTFNTANGLMSCRIVKREVNVGGFRKHIEVAVNQRDEVNLLGLNFFAELDYIIDSKNSCIYVWERSKPRTRAAHTLNELRIEDIAQSAEQWLSEY